MDARHLSKLLLLGLLLTLNTSFYSIVPYFSQVANDELRMSPTQIGYVFASFPLGYMGVSLLIAVLNFGHWPVSRVNTLMRVAVTFVVAFLIMFSLVPTIFSSRRHTSASAVRFTVLFAAFRGSLGASVAVVDAALLLYVVKMFPDAVSTVVGEWEAVAGLGCVIGPPIGAGLFAAGGFAAPLLVTASTAMLVSIVTYIVDRRCVQLHAAGASAGAAAGSSPADEGRCEASDGCGDEKFTLTHFKRLLLLPPVAVVGPCFFSLAGLVAFTFLESMVPLYLKEHFGMGPTPVGILVGATAVIYAFVAVGLGRGIGGDRAVFRPYVLMVSGIVLGVLFFFCGPVAEPVGLSQENYGGHSRAKAIVATAICLFGGGLALVTVTGASMVVDSARLQSAALVPPAGSLNNISASLGALIGPIGGSHLVDRFGFQNAFFGFGCFFVCLSAVYCLGYQLHLSRHGPLRWAAPSEPFSPAFSSVSPPGDVSGFSHCADGGEPRINAREALLGVDERAPLIVAP